MLVSAVSTISPMPSRKNLVLRLENTENSSNRNKKGVVFEVK